MILPILNIVGLLIKAFNVIAESRQSSQEPLTPVMLTAIIPICTGALIENNILRKEKSVQEISSFQDSFADAARQNFKFLENLTDVDGIKFIQLTYAVLLNTNDPEEYEKALSTWIRESHVILSICKE